MAKRSASSIVLLIVSVLLFSVFISPTNSNAASGTYVNDINTTEVEAATEKVEELSNELSSFIKDNPAANDEEILSEFFAEGNTISGEELEALNDSAQGTVAIQEAVNATEEEIEDAQILETTEVANREITVYKNGIVGIEEAQPNTSTVATDGGFSIMATKTKIASATKSYYSWVGLKLFTVSVSSKFNYTGSKASYGGGFDNYYKRGTLSAWTVTDWDGDKEPIGTSYSAWTKGNFQFGVQAKGIGLVMQELYIRHTVTVSKTGKVTKNFLKR